MAAVNVELTRGNTTTINNTAITDGQILFDTQTGAQYLDNGTTRLQIGIAGVMVSSLSEISTITEAGNIPDALAVKELNSNVSHIGEIDYSYTAIGTPIGTTGQTYTITRAGTKLIVFEERIEANKGIMIAINGTVIMEQYNNSSTLQPISIVFVKNLSVGDIVKFYTNGAAYSSTMAQVVSLN